MGKSKGGREAADRGYSPGFVPRPPDYKVSVYRKRDGHKGTVGAAWRNEDGSISVRLAPFVVLDQADDLMVTLFVDDGGPPEPPARPRPERPTPPGDRPDDPGGDIPF